MSGMVVFDYDPNNLPTEAQAAIGLIVACSAQAEGVIEMAIAGCLGLDLITSQAITVHMSSPLRTDVLKSVAEMKIENPKDLHELDDLIDKLNTAMSKRNGVAHNAWCMNPNTKELFTEKRSARGSVEINRIPMSIVEITANASAIHSTSLQLITFLAEKGLMPPQPKSHLTRFHANKAARKHFRKKK